MSKKLWEYVEEVNKHKIITCKAVQQSVNRFQSDIKRSKDDPSFEWTFNETEGDKVVKFIEALKHYEGVFAGKQIILEPWQHFIICNIYGWVKKDDPTVKRFRKAFIYTARKNGKTLLMSALALYGLLTEPSAQVYSAAVKREQASIAFRNVKEFVRHNPTLQELIKVYRYRIVREETASFFEALASDAKSLDGLNPSTAIIDEIAAQGSSALIDVIQSGQYSRKNPLLLEITTASHNMQSVGYLEYEAAKKILQGITKDERFFTIIFELDENDNWRNEKTYIKANPNLNITVPLEALMQARDEAVRVSYKETEFRCKNLNQWMNANHTWISDQVWQKNLQTDSYEERLGDFLCVGAVDLSKRNDITAYTKYFYCPEDDKYIARHKFYIPEEQIDSKMRSDSMQIRKWIEQGYITAVPGETIDYQYLYDDIKADLNRYHLQEIAFDKWNAADLERQIGPLTTLVEFPQSMKNMSGPAKDFEATILKGKNVDNNPVVRWMNSCTVIYIDPSGNIKPRKDGDPASSSRIDGIITSIMALARLQYNIENNPIDNRTPEEIEAEMEKLMAEIEY